MRLNYAVEVLNTALHKEMLPMQEQYWEEVAEPFHDFPPDVDWGTYLKAQATGKLKVVCGRNESGELKAAAFILITPHPHYACICASIPLLFVHPEYRGNGLMLIRIAEMEAQKAGAQMIMTHGGMHNGVAKIFGHMKYSDFGRYFVKVLPDGPNGVRPMFKVT